ncbi:TRM-domain-containing protein [Lophium mytilinum]|uniref:tRNA (guanine(26)-N(2))-dimethyltransferase n=1 Tax=Lophium mytilinum TaxID=390894 RepID=A0A6A6R919_9PEZI|nr:TRM-domain-containing protein [Lophium mytilinum]
MAADAVDTQVRQTSQELTPTTDRVAIDTESPPNSREPTPTKDPATIDADPCADQLVAHDGVNFTTIKEGLAYILVPQGTPTSTDPKAPKEDADKQSVFYNPIQQFNRDLSVLAIRAFGEDFVAAQKLRKEAEHNKPANKRKWDKKRQKKKELKNLGRKGENEEIGPQSPTKKRRIEGSGEQVEVTDGRIHELGALMPDQEEMEIDIIVDKPEAASHEKEVLPSSTENAVVQVPTNSAPGEIPQMFGEGSKGDVIAGNANPTDQLAPPNSAVPGLNGNTPPPKPDIRILDALSATGLRALRYAQEFPFATAVTANDMSQKATASIALNVKHNKLEDKITPNTGNAIAHMYSFVGTKGYDVIDLDPYGTAAPFLDSALQALTHGGLLCVTCTDSGVFASTGYLEKTYSQYGGLPIKGFHSHEGGLRLILHAIATSAARYGMATEPLLSLSIDYYARVFVRVRRSPAEVKFLAGKQMLVYSCDAGCGAWQTQFLARNIPRENKDGSLYYKHSFAQAPSASPFCEHCGTKTHLSGPMYGGPLHNPAFIERILDFLPHIDKETYATTARIEGMLQTAYEETLVDAPVVSKRGKPTKDSETAENKTADTDLYSSSIPKMDPAQIDHHPFFFTPSNLSKVIHCQAPPDAAIRGALRNAGFRATRSHCKPGTIRTDASWKDLWHIMREWVKQKAPVRKGALSEGSAGWKILRLGEGEAERARDGDGEGEQEDGGKGEGGQRYKVVFDEKLGRDEGPKLMRYQINPRANWGPMNRAK